MTDQNKKGPNLTLLLPLGLLLVEVIAIVVLLLTGFEINQTLIFFLALLGIFLLWQVGRQFFTQWRVKQAIKKASEADSIAEAGRPMEAMKIWKKLLLSLPRDKYLQTLANMEKVYKDQEMEEAVQQVKAIHSESLEFFDMTQNIKRITPKDRRKWQARAYELRKMISALPEEKGQSLSDVKPEQ